MAGATYELAKVTRQLATDTLSVVQMTTDALSRVRGHAAHGRNFGDLSIVCDRRIRGVCLSRGDRLGRLFDGEDLLRH